MTPTWLLNAGVSKRNAITVISGTSLPRFAVQGSHQTNFGQGEKNRSYAVLHLSMSATERIKDKQQRSLRHADHQKLHPRASSSIHGHLRGSRKTVMHETEYESQRLCYSWGHSFVGHSQPFQWSLEMFCSEATLTNCSGYKVKLKSLHGPGIRRLFCLSSSQYECPRHCWDVSGPGRLS